MLASVEETSAEGYQMFVVVLPLRKTEQKKDAGNSRINFVTVACQSRQRLLPAAYCALPDTWRSIATVSGPLRPDAPRSRVSPIRIYVLASQRENNTHPCALSLPGPFLLRGLGDRRQEERECGPACVCVAVSLVARCICPTSAWPSEIIACARVLNLPCLMVAGNRSLELQLVGFSRAKMFSWCSLGVRYSCTPALTNRLFRPRLVFIFLCGEAFL